MTAKDLIKERVNEMPEKQAQIVARFMFWLEGETLSKTELKKVERGKAEIDRGEWVDWREAYAGI